LRGIDAKRRATTVFVVPARLARQKIDSSSYQKNSQQQKNSSERPRPFTDFFDDREFGFGAHITALGLVTVVTRETHRSAVAL
jgi:hypothetical protein